MNQLWFCLYPAAVIWCYRDLHYLASPVRSRTTRGFHEKLKLIAAGDFTVKFATDRQDEIGDMAVFNLTAIVKDLQESFSE